MKNESVASPIKYELSLLYKSAKGLSIEFDDLKSELEYVDEETLGDIKLGVQNIKEKILEVESILNNLQNWKQIGFTE